MLRGDTLDTLDVRDRACEPQHAEVHARREIEPRDGIPEEGVLCLAEHTEGINVFIRHLAIVRPTRPREPPQLDSPCSFDSRAHIRGRLAGFTTSVELLGTDTWHADEEVDTIEDGS